MSERKRTDIAAYQDNNGNLEADTQNVLRI